MTEAYEILSDENKRQMYDQFGHAGVDPNFQQQQQNPFGGAGGFGFGDGSFHFQSSSGGAGNEDVEEIFEMFFGGGGRRRNRGPRRGSDLQMQVELSFAEAVEGVNKDLKVNYQQVDHRTGRVSVKERNVKVEVPPGVDTGMNLRLKGKGAEGDPGAPAGNLLVQIIVGKDDYFHRDGHDVHTEQSISVTQAILGGVTDVKTLTGTVELKIPAGSQPDTKLLIRGRGIQRLHSTGKGNHYVHLKVAIPKKISSRQEELLREFDEAGSETFTGRIASAAGSAFKTMFGKKCKDEDKKKNGKKRKARSSSKNEDSEDSDEETNKQAV